MCECLRQWSKDKPFGGVQVSSLFSSTRATCLQEISFWKSKSCNRCSDPHRDHLISPKLDWDYMKRQKQLPQVVVGETVLKFSRSSKSTEPIEIIHCFKKLKILHGGDICRLKHVSVRKTQACKLYTHTPLIYTNKTMYYCCTIKCLQYKTNPNSVKNNVDVSSKGSLRSRLLTSNLWNDRSKQTNMAASLLVSSTVLRAYISFIEEIVAVVFLSTTHARVLHFNWFIL